MGPLAVDTRQVYIRFVSPQNVTDQTNLLLGNSPFPPRAGQGSAKTWHRSAVTYLVFAMKGRFAKVAQRYCPHPFRYVS